jgi:hypothetical protein
VFISKIVLLKIHTCREFMHKMVKMALTMMSDDQLDCTEIEKGEDIDMVGKNQRRLVACQAF